MKSWKKNIFANIGVIIFFILLTLIYFYINNSNPNLKSILGAVFGGISVGIINICINMKKKEKIEVQENDERNTFIRQKANEITSTFLIIAISLYGLLCIFLNKLDHLHSIAIFLGLYSIIFLITVAILNKKY